MRSYTSYSCLDLLFWLKSNGQIRNFNLEEIRIICNNPIDKNKTRNITHFFDFKGKTYVLKQFNDSFRNYRLFFETEKEILKLKITSLPKLVESDDLKCVLILEKIEDYLTLKTIFKGIPKREINISDYKELNDFLVLLAKNIANFHNIDSLINNDPKRLNTDSKVYQWSNKFLRIKEAIINLNTANLKLCHGDIKESNIIIQNKDVSLIDFEMANYNTPYLDLANVFKLLIPYCFDDFFFITKKVKPYQRHDFFKSCFNHFLFNYFENLNDTNFKKLDTQQLKYAVVLNFLDQVESENYFTNIDTVIDYL